MKKILFSLGLVALLAGCAQFPFSAKLPFTQDLREQYGVTADEIRRIQFFTSDEIVLERRIHKQTGTATKGSRLELVKKDLIRQIVIPAHTPCVAIAVTNDMIEVSFEQGKSLHFGSSPAKRKETKGAYSLLARDWTGGRGTIAYGDDIYTTVPGAGAVYLVVDVDDIRGFRVVGKTLKGVTVADRELADYYQTVIDRTVEGGPTNAPAPVAPK